MAMKDKENLNVLELLKTAVMWLDRGVPISPDHNCGNPDSCCDTDCMDFAYFCKDLLKMKRVLKENA